MKLDSKYHCPICGIKKGRQFDHSKCSKVLQQQHNVKTKASKVLRKGMENYVATLDGYCR